MEQRNLLAGDLFGGGWGTDALCVVPEAMGDVTGDNVVSAGDVLAIVNFLNGRNDGGGTGARPVDMQTFQYDVDGSGWVTPSDALMVVNWVNQRGPYRVADVLRCSNVVTFQQSSPAEVFAQQGEDSVLIATQVWAGRAEAVVRGFEISGKLESFDELYVSIDWNGDGYQDDTVPVDYVWDGGLEPSYAWFNLESVESTAPKYGYLGIELHGTPTTGVGSQATIEMTYASVESFPGFDTWAETEGVAVTVTTVDLEVSVIDLPTTFFPGESNVCLGTVGFDVVGADTVNVTDDVFVQVRAEFPEGVGPIWPSGAFPHILLSGDNAAQEGWGWSGSWADGGNAIEEVFRFEQMPLGDSVYYDVIAISSADIPAGSHFQISVVEEFWPHEVVSPGAIGEWHEAVDAAFAEGV